MSATASQIASLTIVYSTVYSGADHRKHQSSASLVFVGGIPRWPVNSPHKGPVTQKVLPFNDVIMIAEKSSTWMMGVGVWQLQVPLISAGGLWAWSVFAGINHTNLDVDGWWEYQWKQPALIYLLLFTHAQIFVGGAVIHVYQGWF